MNLIPDNPTSGLPFRRPSSEDVERFAEVLREANIVTTVRWSRGLEESAACGQLRLSRSGA